MKIGVFGTGDVGMTLSAALAAKGHDVVMGTRDVKKKLDESRRDEGAADFRSWASKHKKVRLCTFAETAAHGELLMNATAGHASLEALAKAKPGDLSGKILIDVANPLGPWNEGTMELFVVNSDSLAERIQRTYPGLRVVKALNTVTAHIMVNPGGLAGGDHDLFVAGNDPEARDRVAHFLREEFGWRTVIDLGDLTAARGMEMLIMLWLKLWAALGTADFNYKIVR
jgi:hypothetical protein